MRILSEYYGGTPAASVLGYKEGAASYVLPLMSLKFRVLGSIAALLILSLLSGAVLLSVHARSLVDLEIRAAFNGAERSVRETLRSDVEHTVTLREVVTSFQGQRHVRAALVNESAKVIVQSEIAPLVDPAPAWFARIIAPRSLTSRIPITLPGYPCTVVLTSDPRSELAEVWGHVRDAFVIMLLFCVSTMVVVSLAVSAGLKLLDRFQAGLQAISGSRYDARLEISGPPEFARLAQGFNHMASRLAHFSRSNSQLYAQLQTAQEEERAEIARNLHDEVGPYLFALQVDAKAIAKMGTPETDGLGASIRESVMHIQRHVRDILRQLRPVTQLEFGLEAAMGDLAAFWGRRNPKIRFALDISLPVTPGRRQEEAAYRLVQEAVSNAVRHGQPDRIEIVLRADDGGLTILVEDNGGGFKGVNRDSMSLGKAGIAGMRERVLALGGALDITNLAGRGVRVSATIPLSLAHEPA